MATHMRSLLDKLIEQQSEIFGIMELEKRPRPRAPISASLLQQIESQFTGWGFYLGSAYRDFLQTCDGIENFSISFDLLGAQDILDPAYEARWRNVLKDGIGYSYDESLPPLLVGCNEETTTRVFMDFGHEQLTAGEPVVFEGDPGDTSIYPSFLSLLEIRVDANTNTIRELLTMKNEP